MGLPAGVRPYRRTETFTEATVPKGLLRAHATGAGVWALIHVEAGHLAYRITDPRRPGCERLLTPATSVGVIEPGVLHEVEPLGPVRFYVEFHRLGGDLGPGERPRGPPR